jgi:uncharacterized protein YciI
VRPVLITIAAALVMIGAARAAEVYDPELATRLGADKGGMRSYILVILRTGPNDAAIQGDERDKLFAGHFANMGRLAGAGKLVVAGPLSKNDKQYRGIFIMPVASAEEALAELNGDPTVKRGIFVVETYGLYGSAAPMEVPQIHKRIEKTAK